MHARSTLVQGSRFQEVAANSLTESSGEIGMVGSTGMQPEELSIRIDGIRQGHISSFLSGYLF
jgi:hypothetical protein